MNSTDSVRVQYYVHVQSINFAILTFISHQCNVWWWISFTEYFIDSCQPVIKVLKTRVVCDVVYQQHSLQERSNTLQEQNV